MDGKSVSEQIRSVAAAYPQIDLVWYTRWAAYWRGPLRSFEGQPEYIVGILYQPSGPGISDRRWENLVVKAWLIDPQVEPRLGPDNKVYIPPHIWPQFKDALCFYKPDVDTPHGDVDIAEMAIPWIIKWLAAYELWLSTGIWIGPQTHPTLPPTVGQPISNQGEAGVPTGSSSNAVARLLGPLNGSFASLALMVAASEGSYQWPFSLSLNGAISAAGLSRAISIWLLEHQQAELSPSALELA